MAQFLVCGAAVLVVLQAAREGKYLWAAAFFAVAVAFNPLAPLSLSRSVFLWVDLTCLAMFLAAAAYVKSSPRLAVASVTDTGSRSESL